jgi:hypothetical protein
MFNPYLLDPPKYQPIMECNSLFSHKPHVCRLLQVCQMPDPDQNQLLWWSHSCLLKGSEVLNPCVALAFGGKTVQLGWSEMSTQVNRGGKRSGRFRHFTKIRNGTCNKTEDVEA